MVVGGKGRRHGDLRRGALRKGRRSGDQRKGALGKGCRKGDLKRQFHTRSAICEEEIEPLKKVCRKGGAPGTWGV